MRNIVVEDDYDKLCFSKYKIWTLVGNKNNNIKGLNSYRAGNVFNYVLLV